MSAFTTASLAEEVVLDAEGQVDLHRLMVDRVLNVALHAVVLDAHRVLGRLVRRRRNLRRRLGLHRPFRFRDEVRARIRPRRVLGRVDRHVALGEISHLNLY